jgi:hypothetical protein
VVFATVGSDFNTLLAVYTGTLASGQREVDLMERGDGK